MTAPFAHPFPQSASSAGKGKVVVRLQPNGYSGLEVITYQYPLKLISPAASPHQKSVLIFLLSYGGGLVGGDEIDLTIEINQSSKLSIVTQGHTKVFKSPSPDVTTRQKLSVRIDTGAGLCLLPDPVQPFKNSVYEQVQIFKLAYNASLVLLDWVTQGRSARGENWSFWRWKGKNEIWVDTPEHSHGRMLVRDTVVLEGDQTQVLHKTLQETMQSQAVVGTLILRGPMSNKIGAFFMNEFAALPRIGSRDFARGKENLGDTDEDKTWRQKRLELEKQNGILWSAANIRGCIMVKFGSTSVEGGRLWVGSMLEKQGDIAALFGTQSLMCVR